MSSGPGSARTRAIRSRSCRVRLGSQHWPALPVRIFGAAGLAWWPRELAVARVIAVAPDVA